MLLHHRIPASLYVLPSPALDARQRWHIPSGGACSTSGNSSVGAGQWQCQRSCRRSRLPLVVRADAAEATFRSARGQRGGIGSRQKTYDVVTLGNLCVDVMVPVARLPAPDLGDPLALPPTSITPLRPVIHDQRRLSGTTAACLLCTASALSRPCMQRAPLVRVHLPSPQSPQYECPSMLQYTAVAAVDAHKNLMWHSFCMGQ